MRRAPTLLTLLLFLVVALSPCCVEEGAMVQIEYVPQSDQAIDCGIAGIAMLIKHACPEVGYGEIVSSLAMPCTCSYIPGSLASQATWLWDEDYAFQASLYGLEYVSSPHQGNATGAHYDEYLREIKDSIDQGVPVMIGGWDLYYDKFYLDRLEGWGLGPGQAGHNIVVVGYDREGIHYLDPGAVVNQRDEIGNVTFFQRYDDFRLAVTSLPGPGTLHYCIYEKVGDPLPEDERSRLIRARNLAKFYGDPEAYDQVYAEAYRHSAFGSEALEALRQDLEPDNLSQILPQRKTHLKEGFLASSLGVGSVRYMCYTNAWAAGWGSAYYEETGDEEGAAMMADLSARFREGDALFTEIIQAYDREGSWNPDDLSQLQTTVEEIDRLYAALQEEDDPLRSSE